MDIEVNGTHYASWDDVPAELRAIIDQALPDASHGGAPGSLTATDSGWGDLSRLLGSAGSAGAPGVHVTSTTTSVQVGDTTYGSLEEVPPQIREMLRRAGVIDPSGASSAGPGVDAGWRPGSRPTAADPTDAPFGPPPTAAGPPAPPPSSPPSSPPPSPPPPTAPPTVAPPTPDQVVLNGVPVSLDAATGRPTRRRWWRRDR